MDRGALGWTGLTPGRRARRFGGAVEAVETALAPVLGMGATLFFRSLGIRWPSGCARRLLVRRPVRRLREAVEGRVRRTGGTRSGGSDRACRARGRFGI